MKTPLVKGGQGRDGASVQLEGMIGGALIALLIVALVACALAC